jgi:multiple sugar transport system permease protein
MRSIFSLSRMHPLTRRNLRNGLLFTAPWLVGFISFTAYPVLASLYYSFTQYDVLSPPHWVGLGNYRQLVSDPLFWTSLYNTLYYAVFFIPVSLVLQITIAMLLNFRVHGMVLYRTIVYLPSIVPTVAGSLLWLWMLNPQFGLVNQALSFLHIATPGWFSDPAWSKPALILMSMWGIGTGIVIYLAGLQNIPQHLYEAAELDGAGVIAKTIYVTIPMLTPTILFNLVMSLIGTFQYFAQVYIITNGGPLDSTLFYGLYLYNNAFAYLRMGYASALAWILTRIILFITMGVFKSSGRWVYYGGVR